jgi:hypothetical protein
MEKLSRIRGSHGGEYEDGCVLGCSTLMMEAARTFETLANFYQTTRRYNQKDSHLLWKNCQDSWSLG